MAKGEILIVDDNQLNLKLIRVLLVGEGYSVKTAGDAEEAIAMLETALPDLILMDVQLPGMDGLELTRRLKSDPERRKIVILALTAYAMKGDEEKARAAGADGYLTKPVDTRTLPEVIAGYLERRGG
ncbi:MAG TPA: response regulator [Candidatus Binataceae bacterium]|nr:response regulator [Candidatus Binataceae bacterium]